jgi:lipoprotein NlpD
MRTRLKPALAWLAVLAAALVLAGCASRRDPAPVIERLPGKYSAAKPAPSGVAQVPDGFYAVKRGDTLYSIALDNGADYREVAQWNGIDDPSKLSIGQLLRVKPPEGRAASGVQVNPARSGGRVESRPLEGSARQGSGDGGTKTEPKVARLPYSKENAAAVAKEERQEAKAEAIEFIWPVKGKVLAGFAEPRSKGIDIDGKLGDPIVAAAAGRVTYIGSGIPGLGKLVVIKHDNGFITVYAHNKEIVVKEQQAVTRGQKIAELGATDSERPKLHFQIRRGAAAVDPLKYLPGA